MEHLMDIDDFELQPAGYRTLLNVLTEDQEFEHQVCAHHDDPVEACDFAEKKAKEMREIMNSCIYNWDGKDILAASITVETVVLVDGEEDYAGQIFNETVYVKEIEK